MIEAFIPISPYIENTNPEKPPCEQVIVGEPNAEGQNTWYLDGEHILSTPGAWNIWRVYAELESYGYCTPPFSEAEAAKIIWGNKNFKPPEPALSDSGRARAEFVSKQALTWKGVAYRPGVTARCAEWVRYVFEQTGIPVGEASESYGPLMADSFYGEGEELGQMIFDPSQLMPGDVVMFKNTYNGPGRTKPGYGGNGKITHVGIYVGNGMMVDRPTASDPVRHRSISTFQFHSALRPQAFL